ncbi:MAG: Sca4 family protein [Rickettsiaceae bacterium]
MSKKNEKESKSLERPRNAEWEDLDQQRDQDWEDLNNEQWEDLTRNQLDDWNIDEVDGSVQEPPNMDANLEPMAQDTIIFGDNQVSTNFPEINLTEVVDPITQAIRDEIIIKQQLYLQQQLAETMQEPDKSTFASQDLAAMREYLRTVDGKNAAKEVMQKPEVQTMMHSIESSGYKTVHTKFQDSFKTVDWGAILGDKVRTTEIKNSNDEVVATLQETTIDTQPTSLMLADGTLRTVKSYRQIDFRKELENGAGPLHLSMAVKDENGKNIAAKDAVYFTAHYDDNGKLTEVSSPIPVKFMGTGPDAIGYIERNGKVYTLPVTQGKYQEMMQELAINNGIGVAMEQAMDIAIAPDRELDIDVPEPRRNPAELAQNNHQSLEEQLKAQRAKLKPIDKSHLQDQPLPQPSLEEQLQSQRAKLKPVDKSHLQDQPLPQPSLEEQLQSQRAKLKPVDKSHLQSNLSQKQNTQKLEFQQVRDNLKKTDKSHIKDWPEQNPQPIDKSHLQDHPPQELSTQEQLQPVQSNLREADQGQNTQKVSSAEVIQHVQRIRASLEGQSIPNQSQTMSDEDKALSMLNGKSTAEASQIIAETIKQGNAKLTGAMMGVIDKPPEDKNIPKISKVGLNKIYIDSMSKAQELSLNDKTNAHRAAGAIADKAGIIDHAKRVSTSQGSGGIKR